MPQIRVDIRPIRVDVGKIPVVNEPKPIGEPERVADRGQERSDGVSDGGPLQLSESTAEVGTVESQDVMAIEQGRHSKGDTQQSGGSNFAFADGGARYLKYGQMFLPENLWAVTDLWRTNGVFTP